MIMILNKKKIETFKNKIIEFDDKFYLKIINKTLYIIIYDKLDVIYLFKYINDNIQLIKICYSCVNFRDIKLLDEDTFLIFNGREWKICTWTEI